MHLRISTRIRGVLAAIIGYAGILDAQSTEVFELAPFEVIGSPERSFALPGSNHLVTGPELDQLQIDDINDALRSLPGVYLREEDGFGLFPNISLRGVDGARSAKVTILEDGIPMAPAPYSAPSAYYAPTTGRMSGIEVLKGSSQVKFGPHTTGGVVSYLSTPVPANDRLSGRIQTSYGTDDDIRFHGYAGETMAYGEGGEIGALLEIYHRANEGFKTIDAAGDFAGSGDTGLERTDYQAKLSWTPSADSPHTFGFRAGYTDLDGDVTYLGLAESDFAAAPYRRYAASRFDNIQSRQSRFSVNHRWQLGESAELSTQVYANQFHRNWYKLNDIRDIDTDGDGVPESLEPGGSRVGMDLSAALAGSTPETAQGLEVLRGDRAGLLRIRANNRSYGAAGVQIQLNAVLGDGRVVHEFNLGGSFHHDYIRRFQWHDLARQETGGSWSDLTRSTPGSDGNRLQETDAFSLFINDRIVFDRFTVEPGIRYERLDQYYADYAGGDSGSGNLDVFAPGVGLTWRATEDSLLFAGIYRGYSLPGPRAAIRSGISEETSTALELGFRYAPDPVTHLEAVFFHTGFDDLIVIDNVGGAGSGNTENVGSVTTQGIEFAFETDLLRGQDDRAVPARLALTWTDATLDGDSRSPDAESIFAGGLDGNRLPYIPEWQLHASVGFDAGPWSAFLSANWIGERFSTASESTDLVNPVSGEPDARFGALDSHFLIDLSLNWQVSTDARIFLVADNLFDEVYIASRHPHGARPGAPQSLRAGIDWRF